MNRIDRAIISIIVTVLVTIVGFAQNPIPNPGFENWTGTEPDGWFTNNAPGFAQPVKQSSTSHSGSYSAQVEVVSFLGSPYPGWMQAWFPVSQRHANLTFWFQFLQVGADGAYATVYMTSNGNLVGAGAGFTYEAQSSWTQTLIEIEYFSLDVPDTCYISIGVSGDSLGNDPNLGTLARIDDLAFSGVVSVKEGVQHPLGYSLEQNYPNPFNPITNIEFSIPQSSDVELVIYNPLGQTVATLVKEQLSAGSYSVDWNAKGFPSGIYFYRITAGDFTQTRKLLLAK